MNRPGSSTSFVTPPRASFFQKLGPGGLPSLLLALVTLAAGLGMPLIYRIRQVLRSREGDLPKRVDLILVLGRKLEQDRPTAMFEARLAWALELWRAGFAGCIVVAGGTTGRASRSEAEAGREWLLAHGLPEEAVSLEDRSQHTLENLFNVRSLMQKRGWNRLMLVSDPLHLARARAFAKGLRLYPVCIPAKGAPPRFMSPAWIQRLLLEGFLLHWYHVGMAYSRLTGAQRQLERVT